MEGFTSQIDVEQDLKKMRVRSWKKLTQKKSILKKLRRPKPTTGLETGNTCCPWNHGLRSRNLLSRFLAQSVTSVTSDS